MLLLVTAEVARAKVPKAAVTTATVDDGMSLAGIKHSVLTLVHAYMKDKTQAVTAASITCVKPFESTITVKHDRKARQTPAALDAFQNATGC